MDKIIFNYLLKLFYFKINKLYKFSSYIFKKAESMNNIHDKFKIGDKNDITK